MTTREKLDAIRSELLGWPDFDPELWRLFDRTTLKLRNIHVDNLVQRYRQVATSLLWLRRPSMDIEPIASGHYSTCWWLRMLAQTEAELERRQIANIYVPDSVVWEPSVVRTGV